jgi:CheY-like chemotaxis protein
LSIINDILDFSKIEAGKLDLVETNFDLLNLLDNINTMFRIMCISKDLTLDFVIDRSVPQTVYSDEGRLRQIITNVISNAVKYTVVGGISVSVGSAKDPHKLAVPQDLSSCNNQAIDKDNQLWIQFAIKDTGIGIRKADLARLFKPFEQLDVRKNRQIVGTGLGLTITKNLCELMGGTLSVESVYKQGSTFVITLPFYSLQADSTTPKDIETPDFIAPKASVLVVDDLDINLAVAEALLSTFEIVPDSALSGDEALQMTQTKKYDLIFMDHMMPNLDGVDTTKLIRTVENANINVPIIALTANVVSGMREMFLENQFNDFLPKPIDLKELGRELYQWLPSDVVEKVGE